MTTAVNLYPSEITTPYEAAIKAALNDLRSISEEQQRAHKRLSELARRTNDIEATIRSLIALLPSEAALKYQDILESGATDKLPVDDNRGGELYNNVVSLVFSKPRQEWNSASIRDEFKKTGVEADTKSILNVLNYLKNTGRLMRISRGRYRVTDSGVMVECGLDIEGDD